MEKTFNPLTDLGIKFTEPDRHCDCSARVTLDNGCVMELKYTKFKMSEDEDVYNDRYTFESFNPDGVRVNSGWGDCVEDFQKEIKRLTGYEYTYFGKSVITRPDGSVEEKEFYRWASEEERKYTSLKAVLFYGITPTRRRQGND